MILKQNLLQMACLKELFAGRPQEILAGSLSPSGQTVIWLSPIHNSHRRRSRMHVIRPSNSLQKQHLLLGNEPLGRLAPRNSLSALA